MVLRLPRSLTPGRYVPLAQGRSDSMVRTSRPGQRCQAKEKHQTYHQAAEGEAPED